MDYNPKTDLAAYPHIRAMLSGLPLQLWYEFLPATAAGLNDMELNIISFRAKEQERDQVMTLQELCEMPLRPNQSLRETKVKARIQGRKKEALLRRYNKDREDLV